VFFVSFDFNNVEAEPSNVIMKERIRCEILQRLWQLQCIVCVIILSPKYFLMGENVCRNTWFGN